MPYHCRVVLHFVILIWWGTLGWFFLLAITNKVPGNIYVQDFGQKFSFLLCKYPGVDDWIIPYYASRNVPTLRSSTILHPHSQGTGFCSGAPSRHSTHSSIPTAAVRTEVPTEVPSCLLVDFNSNCFSAFWLRSSVDFNSHWPQNRRRWASLHLLVCHLSNLLPI